MSWQERSGGREGDIREEGPFKIILIFIMLKNDEGKNACTYLQHKGPKKQT